MAPCYRIHLLMQETWVRSLGWEEPLEKEMGTHSSFLAWEIPPTEEPGGLGGYSHGAAKSRTRLSDFTFTFRARKEKLFDGTVERQKCVLDM